MDFEIDCMIGGKSGIGNRKHRISGVVPHNKTNAMRRAREANKEIEQKEKIKKSHKNEMLNSVKKLMEGK